MLKLTKLQIFKILILYTLLALAAVCCCNIKQLLAPARRRPFQCNDESLSKPFVNDTVSTKQLYTLGIYFPIILIAACELISSFKTRKSPILSSWILKYVLKCGVVLTLYLIGLVVERLYKNVAKIKMARLRPNFMTVCNPVNSDGFRCYGLEDTSVMDKYECSSQLYPAWAVSTAFESFPSGHTSLMSYSMVFLIFYLQLFNWRLERLKFSLVTLIKQALCFFMILFVAVSRVIDFRHHWSDVFAGFIGGSSVALVLSYYLKSQLENIEKWVKEVVAVSHTTDDIETATTACVNKNRNEIQESCATELVVK